MSVEKEDKFKAGDYVYYEGINWDEPTPGVVVESRQGVDGEKLYLVDWTTDGANVGMRYVFEKDLRPCNVESDEFQDFLYELKENLEDNPSPKLEPDMVNHPPHYTQHPSGVECIEIVRWMNYNLGNVTKYVWRAGLKGDEDKEIEDLEKALFYIQDEINRRKGLL